MSARKSAFPWIKKSSDGENGARIAPFSLLTAARSAFPRKGARLPFSATLYLFHSFHHTGSCLPPARFPLCILIYMEMLLFLAHEREKDADQAQN